MIFEHAAIIIISYLGIVSGYVILMFVPEERKQGEKYFSLASFTAFYAIAFLSIYFLKPAFVFLPILFTVLFSFFRTNNIAYIFFSALIPFLPSSDAIISISIAIFFYGLSAGALIFRRGESKLKKILSYAYYPAVSIAIMIMQAP